MIGVILDPVAVFQPGPNEIFLFLPPPVWWSKNRKSGLAFFRFDRIEIVWLNENLPCVWLSKFSQSFYYFWTQMLFFPRIIGSILFPLIRSCWKTKIPMALMQMLFSFTVCHLCTKNSRPGTKCIFSGIFPVYLFRCSKWNNPFSIASISECQCGVHPKIYWLSDMEACRLPAFGSR